MEPYFASIKGGYDKNFTYLIGCNETKQLAIIDCAAFLNEFEPYLKEVKDLGFEKINRVILTHAHHDHIISLQQIYSRFQPEVYVHESELKRIKNFTGIEVNNFIHHQQEIEIGNEKIKALHTPGHQPSNFCFVWRNKIFTGDTLFIEGCGRTNFPESSTLDQLESMKFIANELSDDLEVYPGHDYGSIPVSTVGREKKVNKYLIGLQKNEINEQIVENWIAVRTGKK
ncbi:MAG: MBL fold metallo-hydrolase [Candidatus Caenarcaniphilales bacterium]|nr:MBL fold metallo-hydrolase [Candidatus Caenarcaniphilales bacterium]